MDLQEMMSQIGKGAREAARKLSHLSSRVKDGFLLEVASALDRGRGGLLTANARDLKEADKKTSPALLDRLTLDDKRIDGMIASLREVAALPDPVGRVANMWTRPNGLKVGRMRIPLGVIGIIYEARPNVTVEAGALCLKSGNAAILKGGSEALNSNLALGELFSRAAEAVGVPKGAIQVITTAEREAVLHMIKMEEHIDLIIPRGGEELIRFVADNSRIPVIKHFKGVCHIFVDRSADLEMAEEVCLNAKAQRPAVCNAMETMLVHQEVAPRFLPRMARRFAAAKVELRGCPKTLKLIPEARPATEEDWYSEYLDLMLAVRVVAGLDEAIDHITRYGSNHTESIITGDYSNSRRFLEEVNSSVVLVNASTRFSDGYELGLGAEVGISTSKIHAFGPMGLEELTSLKFIVLGDGQVRT